MSLSDLLNASIVPGGFWDRRLNNICNPRRLKWASFYRACHRIPGGTPCHGSTSWSKINSRRHKLIVAKLAGRLKNTTELEALQNVANEIGCGGIVAQNFLMGRYLRKLQRECFDA